MTYYVCIGNQYLFKFTSVHTATGFAELAKENATEELSVWMFFSTEDKNA